MTTSIPPDLVRECTHCLTDLLDKLQALHSQLMATARATDTWWKTEEWATADTLSQWLLTEYLTNTPLGKVIEEHSSHWLHQVEHTYMTRHGSIYDIHLLTHIHTGELSLSPTVTEIQPYLRKMGDALSDDTAAEVIKQLLNLRAAFQAREVKPRCMILINISAMVPTRPVPPRRTAHRRRRRSRSSR